MNDVAAAFACFIVTLLAIAALRPLAIKIDLVDRPGGRKTHHGEVPIIGGIGMFLGISVGMGLLNPTLAPTGPLLASISLMVVLGLIDDRFGLSPWTRLPVQIAAATIAAYGTNTFVTTLGDPLGTGEIVLQGVTSQTMTIFIMVAATNAFNMLDGMDGLAGTAAVIGFAAVGYIAASIGLPNSPRIALIAVAAVSAFLVFNAPLVRNNPIRCFMGDAGSTFLGLAIAWICLRISQNAGNRSIAPVTALWLIALPVYELFWSFTRRIMRGQSPLRADAEHFHHLMIRAGFSVRATFLVFAVLAAAFAVAGIGIEAAGIPEHFSLMLLVLGGVAVIGLAYRANSLVQYLPYRLRRNIVHLSEQPATRNESGAQAATVAVTEIACVNNHS